MTLSVFKFGGASVKDSDNIRNIRTILDKYRDGKLVLVVSAMGKTTNALEEVVQAYIDQDDYTSLLDKIKEDHLKVAEDLSVDLVSYKASINGFIDANFKRLDAVKGISKAAIYDQIISLGELFSTKLIADFLLTQGFDIVWQDVRALIRTDDNYKEGRVDFNVSQENIDSSLKPKLNEHRLVITQGFIASDPNGITTSLGREGSDYTAALLAYFLDVEDLAIWKDVPGVLTADPRKFDNVEKLDRMSYKEAIEMSYYGAQVIHPKTIRPLQNKGIKLHVKSFIDPDKEGTVISLDGLLNYPPIVVIQEDVILMQISSKDYSFIAENHLSQIFELMNRYGIKLSTMRNSAISFTICVKNPGSEILDKFLAELDTSYSVDIFKDLQLYTMRYFNKALIKNLTANKVILFEERMKYTIQMVVRSSMELKEKF